MFAIGAAAAIKSDTKMGVFMWGLLVFISFLLVFLRAFVVYSYHGAGNCIH